MEPETNSESSSSNSNEEKTSVRKQEVARRNGKSPKRAEFVIEQIKEKIRKGILEGKPHSQNYADLGLARSTYYTYVSQMAEDKIESQLKKENALLHEFHERMEEAYRDLYKASKKNPRLIHDRTKVLTEAFDRLQSAGFITKVKEKLETSGEVKFVMEITRRDKNGNPDKLGSK